MTNYNFKETLVLNVNPNHFCSPKKTKVDIVAFSNSSIDLYHTPNEKGEGSSSFPLLIKDVLIQYNLERLVIQSASESIASSSTANHVEYGERLNNPLSIGTPIGTSIFARFVLPPDEKNTTKKFEEELVLHNTKFIFLLRTLNTYNLLSCGATPLSTVTTSSILEQLQESSGSYSQRFHHLQFPNPVRRSNTLPRTVDYYIILPSSNDIGTLICHDNYQAFIALSSPCYSKSTAVGILGTSGITSDVLHASPRKHLWIDASSTTSCFESRKYDTSISSPPCTLSLSQGISYTKYMNLERVQFGKSGERQVSLSLNQLLFVEQGRQKNKAIRKKQQLKPCSFATSSDIIFNVIGSSSSTPTFLQHDPNEMKVFRGNESGPVISSQSKHSLFALLPKAHDRSHNNDGTAADSSLIDLDAAWVTFNYSALSQTKSCSHCTGILRQPSWGIERIHKYLGESSSSTSGIGIGKLQTCIFNGDDSFPALVSLTDYIPSTIFYPLLHTTEIWLHRGICAGDFATFPLCRDQDASDALVQPTYNSTKINLASSSNDYVSECQFVTSPTSGATLELKVQLPPDSSMCISMEYNYRFLPFDAFPSDPNRGINIPPSFAEFSCPTCAVASPSTTLFTSSLLLLPPTPDMTMPFNVISLTTTVYAFIIGSVMNILIRRSSASINKALGKTEADVKSKIKVILTNLKEKVMRLLLWERKRKVKDE